MESEKCTFELIENEMTSAGPAGVCPRFSVNMLYLLACSFVRLVTVGVCVCV